MIRTESLSSKEQVSASESACAHSTIDSFVPKYVAMNGGYEYELEKKYLHPQIYTRNSSDPLMQFGLTSVDTKIERKKRQRLSSGYHTQATDEVLAVERAGYQKLINGIGSLVQARALDLGIGESVDAPQTLKPFEENREWTIKDDGNGNFYMFIRQPGDEQNKLFQVDIGKLAQADIQFVHHIIESFHQLKGLSGLIDDIDYKRRLHKLTPDQVIDPMILDIARSENPDQQIADIWRFIQSTRGVQERDDGRFSYYFTVRNRRLDPFPNGTYADEYTYLSHLIQCEGTSDDDKAIVDASGRVIHNLIEQPPQVEVTYPHMNPAMLKILARPSAFRKEYISGPNAILRRSVKETQKVADVFKISMSSQTPEEIENLIAAELPELRAQLLEFKQWLGLNGLSRSNYEELINDIASHIGLRASLHHVFDERQPTVDDLRQIVTKRFNETAAIYKENKPRFVYGQVERGAFTLPDPISDILGRLGIQHSVVQETLHPPLNPLDAGLKEKKIKILVQWAESIVEPYDKRIQELTSIIKNSEQDRRLFLRFMKQHNIPRQTEAIILQASKLTDEKGGLQSSLEEQIYDRLFRIYFIGHQGVDITTPAFTKFVTGVYPEIKPEQLAVIQKLIEEEQKQRESLVEKVD